MRGVMLELKSVVGSRESDSGGTVRNAKRIQEVVGTFKEAQ